MLIDQHNGNILPVLGVLLKRLLDGGVLGLVVDDEEVLLRVGGRIDVLERRSVISQARAGVAAFEQFTRRRWHGWDKDPRRRAGRTVCMLCV